MKNTMDRENALATKDIGGVPAWTQQADADAYATERGMPALIGYRYDHIFFWSPVPSNFDVLSWRQGVDCITYHRYDRGRGYSETHQIGPLEFARL